MVNMQPHFIGLLKVSFLALILSHPVLEKNLFQKLVKFNVSENKNKVYEGFKTLKIRSSSIDGITR